MTSIVAKMNVLGVQNVEVDGKNYSKLFVCSIPSADEIQSVRGLSVQSIGCTKEVFDNAHLSPSITECELTLKQQSGAGGRIKFLCTAIKAALPEHKK